MALLRTKRFSSKHIKIVFLIALYNVLFWSPFSVHSNTSDIKLELATKYNHENVEEFLISEKYDGVRAIWKNGVLTTKRGHVIKVPKWFTKGLPTTWLDGELWIERNSFERISSVVLKEQPIDSEWRDVKYMVFDMPDFSASFENRYHRYRKIIHSLKIRHIQPVIQHNISSKKALFQLLESLVEKGAEGLILHKKSALFEPGRTDNVLKLKLYSDDEAIVIGYVGGTGRNKDRLGSLVVKYALNEFKNVTFKIGTGFTDLQRKNPPKVGSIITFKHYGFTKNGVPRFASFLKQKQKE